MQHLNTLCLCTVLAGVPNFMVDGGIQSCNNEAPYCMEQLQIGGMSQPRGYDP